MFLLFHGENFPGSLQENEGRKGGGDPRVSRSQKLFTLIER